MIKGRMVSSEEIQQRIENSKIDDKHKIIVLDDSDEDGTMIPSLLKGMIKHMSKSETEISSCADNDDNDAMKRLSNSIFANSRRSRELFICEGSSAMSSFPLTLQPEEIRKAKLRMKLQDLERVYACESNTTRRKKLAKRIKFVEEILDDCPLCKAGFKPTVIKLRGRTKENKLCLE